MTATEVVVNADDFGLVPEVNAAVMAAFAAGSVTSATLIVGAEATEEAASLAREQPRLGVGLHLNLLLGRPLSPGRSVPTLIDGEGRFLARRKLLVRGLTGRLSAADVALETRSQLARFRALGLEPTHIDGHQHAQVLPVIAGVVAAIAREERLPVRFPWVRWRLAAGPVKLAARGALASLCIAAARHGARATSHRFASVIDYGPPARIDADLYARIVRESPPGRLEIMVHPSFASARLEELHPALYRVSIAEAQVLIDPRTAAALRDVGGRLVSFRESG